VTIRRGAALAFAFVAIPIGLLYFASMISTAISIKEWTALQAAMVGMLLLCLSMVVIAGLAALRYGVKGAVSKHL
jgi:hypothetical protein